MKPLLFSLVILLTGCTIQLEDKRLTREEVAAAFQERDAAMEVLTKAIQEMQKPQKKETAK